MAFRAWKNVLSFELDRQRKNLSQQIEDGIVHEISNGRLTPGMLLPGYRELASLLGVSRNTIAAVYTEMASKGILKSVRGKGTLIADHIPHQRDIAVRKVTHKQKLSFTFNEFNNEIITTEVPPGRWQVKVDDGFPDPKLAPSGKFVATYKLMSFRSTRQKKAEYNSGNSFRQLFLEAGRMLRTRRGLHIDDSNLCIIISSKMALYMIAQTLLQKGDVVAVEDPGGAICWQTFQRAGAMLLPVQVDSEGIRTDILERELQQKKIKAVYISPSCQYPTTATLSLQRRKHLIALSEKYGFAIIETDYNHEFSFDPSAPLPLASNNVEGNVIYLTNLSRMMAPLNLICCVAGPAAFIQSLHALYYSIYQRADAVLELTVADMMKTDIIGRAARASLREYRKKRDNMVAYIEKHLHPLVSANVPDAGLALWLIPDQRFNTDNIRKRLLEMDIWIPPANLIAYSKHPPNALRIGYASLSPRESINTIEAIADVLTHLH
ncbi:PLP-dependent aminotransferase family protein [Chitinophaga eiseniae]|uniref:PLP-dependent aminotransferase family protein n=1 Tax=Chitinophaga eiseniae TaxID=634771 RepID=A0A847SI26_9BACT|nr:PLP-dependent aminotransferase family protein [Chitinophaga eiseniae]NLR76988.1 PLP-dependent aminotransferase family protein [Chitinophaga eiseniae]